MLKDVLWPVGKKSNFPRLLLQEFQFNICCLCELTSYQLVLLMNKTVCLWTGMYISNSALDQYGTHSMETQHNPQHSGKQKLATHFCLSLRDTREQTGGFVSFTPVIMSL